MSLIHSGITITSEQLDQIAKVIKVLPKEDLGILQAIQLGKISIIRISKDINSSSSSTGLVERYMRLWKLLLEFIAKICPQISPDECKVVLRKNLDIIYI